MRLTLRSTFAPDDDDLLLALVDDFGPTAVEERERRLGPRLLRHAADRDAAHARARPRDSTVTAVDVADEDWARRSQENLTPITVGRITVVPDADPALRGPRRRARRTPHPESRRDRDRHRPVDGLRHRPSRHDAAVPGGAADDRPRPIDACSTSAPGPACWRLPRSGSARRRRVGIDYDADAIQSARENLALNPDVRRVTFRDRRSGGDRRCRAADVVTANLTGALLVRAAPALLDAGATRRHARSSAGMQAHERDEVARGVRRQLRSAWERDRGRLGRPGREKIVTVNRRLPRSGLIEACMAPTLSRVAVVVVARRPSMRRRSQPAAAARRRASARRSSRRATRRRSPRTRRRRRPAGSAAACWPPTTAGRSSARASSSTPPNCPGGRGMLTDDNGVFELTELPAGPLHADACRRPASSRCRTASGGRCRPARRCSSPTASS